MLMQNNIVDTIPMVVCVGVEYWTGLFDWLKENPVAASYMSDADMRLVRVLDS